MKIKYHNICTSKSYSQCSQTLRNNGRTAGATPSPEIIGTRSKNIKEMRLIGPTYNDVILCAAYFKNFEKMMENETALEVLLACSHDDFSSNARTDILEKYSRFHGKTEFSKWCNAPDVRYIDSFRDLIFQINPHHITCIYKKMFQTAALSNLKIVDGYTCAEEESVCTNGPPCYKTNTSMENDYPGYFQEHVDKSNSCVYNSSSNIKTHISAKGHPKTLEMNGWDICEKPHLAGYSVYLTQNTNEVGDSSRRQSKSQNDRTLSPTVKSYPGMLRLTSNIRRGNTYRNSSAGSSFVKEPNREPSTLSNPSEAATSHSSSSTGSLGSNKIAPIKIGRRFRHFRRNSSYMDQYREEYTYRRLSDSGDLSSFPNNESCICSACLHPVQSEGLERWFPSRSHAEKAKKMLYCKENPSVASRIPVPKRTPVLKKRLPLHAKKQPYVAQIPKLGDAPKSSSAIGFQRDYIPKMDFFAASLTVNNYNPIKTPPSGAHKSASYPASSVLMNCGRTTNSPAHIVANLQHLLNQNIKGTE